MDKEIEAIVEILNTYNKIIIADLIKDSRFNLVKSDTYGSKAHSVISTVEIYSRPANNAKLSILSKEEKQCILDAILQIYPVQDNSPEVVEVLFKVDIGEEISRRAQTANKVGAPIVFISYSWDNDDHNKWVLSLANKLIREGVDVRLDQYELKSGSNLNHFMESTIQIAQKVVLVLTKNYKIKADGRKGGVGYEYSIINSEWCEKLSNNNKFIPILRSGDNKDSVPVFLKSFIFLDMREEEDFDIEFNKLIHDIYDVPIKEKPKLGEKPKFRTEEKEVNANDDYMDKPIDSKIISKIRFNDTPILELDNGVRINAGTIRIENKQLVYYTGKGLREIWKPGNEDEKANAESLKIMPEEWLIKNEYIALIPLWRIVGINRE